MNNKRRTPTIPVTIIGGFLGAGKTTLLNHILSDDHGVRAAVLVNDFGAINIDASLVVAVEGEKVSLTNGCVCCTIRDDLRGACLELLNQDEFPEHLLIELSGVSNPLPVLETFLQPDLASFFSISCSLIVVDAEQLQSLTADLGELARTQIATADLVVLNKVDLSTREGLANVNRSLQQLSPGLRVFETTFGRIPTEMIFETCLRTPGYESARGFSVQRNSPLPIAFETWHWTCDRPLSLPKLRSALSSFPKTIYRAKGIIYLEELPGYKIVLQMVGKRHQLDDTGTWCPETPRTEIVMISGRGGIDVDAMKQALSGCIGTGDESQSPVLRLARKLGLGTPDEQCQTKAVNFAVN